MGLKRGPGKKVISHLWGEKSKQFDFVFWPYFGQVKISPYQLGELEKRGPWASILGLLKFFFRAFARKPFFLLQGNFPYISVFNLNLPTR